MRTNAKQWRFFIELVHATLGIERTGEFDAAPATRLAQYKFEVEKYLSRHYLISNEAHAYVFRIAHESYVKDFDIDIEPTRAAVGRYYLLIRKGSDGCGDGGLPHDKAGMNDYALRVVADGIDAEYTAYKALPAVRLDLLSDTFVPTGPAYNEIANILYRHAKRGWIIDNEYNPSTKRLLSARVVQNNAKGIVVATSEYWYLRWWDTVAARYVYPYRETNRQKYVLSFASDRLMISQNLRPAPRISLPGQVKI
jgi:hypothetical protein